MADTKQIDEDIEILLENSEYTPAAYVNVDDRIINESVDMYVHKEDSERQIIHSQAIDISKMYYQENKKGQQHIQELLEAALNSGNVKHAKTAVYALFQTGQIDFMITKLEEYVFDTVYKKIVFQSLISTLSLLVRYFWKDISKPQIKRLRVLFKDFADIESTRGMNFRSNNSQADISSLLAQLNIVLAQDVKERIEQGFNPEINEDEEKLKEEISKFGFPSDLTEALDKIDQKLQASKDAFDFKGTMDLLRAFTERVYQSILESYGEKGKKVDEKDSEAVARFFKEQGLVNPDFANMITSMRHFLSNTAAHRLKSRNEDARLTKNMVIEMTLYLLIRLKNN